MKIFYHSNLVLILKTFLINTLCFQEGTRLSDGFVETVGGLVVAVLMDLSKAFDWLPHRILLSKLSAYGLSDEAVLLL